MDVATFLCLASLWFIVSGLASVVVSWVMPGNIY